MLFGMAAEAAEAGDAASAYDLMTRSLAMVADDRCLFLFLAASHQQQSRT